MSMLQQGFPAAQMMVCGVLGPKSNAHGPNEFLHVPYGKKLTAAVAQVMAACATVVFSVAQRRVSSAPVGSPSIVRASASATSMPSTPADMMPPA